METRTVKIPRLSGLQVSKIPDYGAEQGKMLTLDEKVEAFITLIQETQLDGEKARIYQGRIEQAFQKSSYDASEKIAQFKDFDQDNNLSREELLEGLEKLLSETKIDTNISRGYLRRNTIQKIVLLFISVILVATGFAMIIMPAPPSFEIFTVFYFTPNDGVTVMDLVSLLIIFGGILLFVLNFNKK